jgi:adenosine deaminase
MKLSHEIINRLPKAELHCHLDGSLRIKTIIDLAQQNHVELPSFNKSDLLAILSIGDSPVPLEDYISRFDITLSVLQTPESLERVAFELAMDCHDDGVRYVEVRYSPILHTKNGMRLSETIDAVKKGLNTAQQECGILTGIIICGIRHISPDHSIELADLAIQYKNKGVVGFDLAGAEENFPAKHHQDAFDMILKNNINTTLHAGEAFGPESIHQAIHSCGAHRIGHGTRLSESRDLLEYVNDHRIPLEMCLTSNIHTKSVISIDEHPFRKYYDQRLRVTLNTDNRLISNTTLTKEYQLASETFNLSLQDLRGIIINGFKSAFLPHNKRRELIKKVVDEMENEFKFDRRVIV